MAEKVIRSVGYRQEEILTDIIHLYAPNGIDADITYSLGNFYKSGEVPQPRMKFDIAPQTKDTVQADCRCLPIADGVCNCVIYDPPFLGTKGKSLESDNGNLMLRRFSCYPTESELFEFYRDSLVEIVRILAEQGVAIIKCQDKVSSGKQYLSHNYLINAAENLGLYCEDLFVLVAKTRILSPKHSNQKHARKYHSYFLVFVKDETKVKRIRRDMNGIHGAKPVETH